MRKGNAMYSLNEHREKIISNIQDFLNYKRTNSINYGSRLIKEFKVINFSGGQDDENLLVQFEGYETMPHANHYWVSKSELEKFLNGNKKIGVSLFVDRTYTEGDRIVFEVNLMKNGAKKPTIYDAEKLKGINIIHNNLLYKSYDAQVKLVDDINIEKVIRLFVFEPFSSDAYIDKHTVIQNKVEIKNGITFEDFDSQEQFVRKFDALEAVRMERKTITTELKAWFLLNMANQVDEQFSEAFLKKLKEII